MDYLIRELKTEEIPLLNDFLYEAIFIPEGMDKPAREVIGQPELQVYVKNFGSEKDDLALVAESDDKIIGTVWVRIMDDYGHIDDDTPSLAISVLEEYRGRGVGTALMKRMLEILSGRGCKGVSLSVQKTNYAASMYRQLGFTVVNENDEEYIMWISLCKCLPIRENPEMAHDAALWFHEKWGIDLDAYESSIAGCIANRDAVPQWYLVVSGDRIIAGCGVIENDFHDRRDLTPNVCAVYVEEDCRGQGIAGQLLQFVCDDMAKLGIRTLYLLTDHTGFYERYGWHFHCMAQGDGEAEPSRMYVYHSMETDRLILRPYMWSDAESLYEYAKDPAIGPVTGWQVHTSVENSLEIIRTVLAAPETYAVCLKEDNKAIGSVGLMIGDHSNIGLPDTEGEIGYWIGVPFWGQGLIPEAVNETIRYAFDTLKLETLWCGYFEGNEKSKRVQEKCGFRYHHTNRDIYWERMDDIRTEHITRLCRNDGKTVDSHA